MKTILISGVTGFLGSHIAEELIGKGYSVVALKRKSSDLWRCKSFINAIYWIDCDDLIQAEKDIKKYNPDILIHCAWGGVSASERENLVEQEKNLTFLVNLLCVVKNTTISKIIALGSQAEYGHFEGSVDENHACRPNSAYGTTKICASIILKSFAKANNIEWYWIRIFSVFGPREEKNWLIPATINNLLVKKEMNLTSCEQKYDYLYVKDFACGILSIVECEKDQSGIYNMSRGSCIQLKEIMTFLELNLSPEQKLLHIGSLPYRPNQVMHMEGNSNRFFSAFGFQPMNDIFEELKITIEYYKTLKDE